MLVSVPKEISRPPTGKGPIHPTCGNDGTSSFSFQTSNIHGGPKQCDRNDRTVSNYSTGMGMKVTFKNDFSNNLDIGSVEDLGFKIMLVRLVDQPHIEISNNSNVIQNKRGKDIMKVPDLEAEGKKAVTQLRGRGSGKMSYPQGKRKSKCFAYLLL